MAQRDGTQRNKIVRAEINFQASRGPVIHVPIRDLDKFVKNIASRSFWKKQFASGVPASIDVAWNTSRSQIRDGCIPDFTFHTTETTVIVDDTTSNRLSVLHSLAHVLCGHSRRDGNLHHSADFVSVYIELVRRFLDNGHINEDTKRAFKTELLAQKVKTKQVSEATRAKHRAAYIVRMTPSEEKLRATLASLEKL